MKILCLPVIFDLIIFVLEMLESIWEGAPIPEEWKFGTLCPIFKLKGETSDPNNWRPV